MTIKAARPTARIIVEPIETGQVVLLQGVPRISSVSAFVQETWSSFGLHGRVCFKTPRLPQLSVHSGSAQSPSMKRSDKMEIKLQNKKKIPTRAWGSVACSFYNPLHCLIFAR